MPRTRLFPRVWRGVGLSIFTRFLYTPTAGAIAALSLKPRPFLGGGVDGGNFNRENGKMKKLTTALIAIALTGCSTAGPYVTNVTPAGTTGLIVEKCVTEFNSMTSQISSKNCSQTYVPVGASSTIPATAPAIANFNNK